MYEKLICTAVTWKPASIYGLLMFVSLGSFTFGISMIITSIYLELIITNNETMIYTVSNYPRFETTIAEIEIESVSLYPYHDVYICTFLWKRVYALSIHRPSNIMWYCSPTGRIGTLLRRGCVLVGFTALLQWEEVVC